MAHAQLSVYLNDHLAGAAAALELLAALAALDGEATWTEPLRAEITADRHELEQLMQQAGIAPSTTRQAAGWLTEKLARLKTRMDDRSGGPLQRLELIEALALGIDGKRALWTGLQAAADAPALRMADYPRLISRAETQRHTVEVRRLAAAANALGEREDRPS